MFDEDSDYDRMVAKWVMELIQVFSQQGHSGGSAGMTLDLFDKVARFQPLTALTSNPAEWIDRTEESGEPMWQSKRSPSVFSRDGGQTWYDLR